MKCDQLPVVIGANFGDEGKGLITDYLAFTNPNSIVIRFNGGAQAGHTVQTPSGRRHVFGHIGAGTFGKAATYLSEYFVCNPVLFEHEMQRLGPFFTPPVIMVDPGCLVTTPWDMFINQAAEDYRRHKRHGSCGVGFGETIERSLHSELVLTVKDLSYITLLNKLLDKDIYEWMRTRLTQLTGDRDYAFQKSDEVFQNHTKIKELFLKAVAEFLDKTKTACIEKVLNYDHLIFEGAQGLALDQNSKYFPHVTRSSTGLHNVCRLMERLNVNAEIVPYYISRTYLTRHGAGPLKGEIGELTYANVEDKTNLAHPYQGMLRFAPLDLDEMIDRIQSDMRFHPRQLNTKLCLTCLDQIPQEDAFPVYYKEKLVSMHYTDLLEIVGKQINAFGYLVSRGPSRDTIFSEKSLVTV
jgi:adenylosuccinate synthase